MCLRTLVLTAAVIFLAACQSGTDVLSQGNVTTGGVGTTQSDTGVSTEGDVAVGAAPTDTGTPAPASPLENTGVGLGQSSTASGGVMLQLTWKANPGPIDGYIVYNGQSPATASSIVSVTNNTTAQFDAVADLGLNPGDSTCFRLRAYNIDGESDYSKAVCIDVKAI